jgi:hypothetical protein
MGTVQNSIFNVIMGDKAINIQLASYLNRMVRFCAFSTNDTNGNATFSMFANSANACGGLDPEGIRELFSNGLLDTTADKGNTRELLTAIMTYSFVCCEHVWKVIYDVSKFDSGDQDPGVKLRIAKYEKYGIDLVVIRMRIEDIEHKYSMPAYKVYELVTKSTTAHITNYGRYPNICHLATNSTTVSLAISKTTALQNVYQRTRGMAKIYDAILDGRDIRLTAQHVYPALSDRETKYIRAHSQTLQSKSKFDAFFVNIDPNSPSPLAIMPWSTGFMTQQISPDNLFVMRAVELSRYVVLGPSGTLEGMLNVAEIFGMDLKMMALAAMAWMYIARDHALYEMMIIANDIIGENIFTFDKIGQTFDETLKIDRQQVIDLYRDTMKIQHLVNVDVNVDLFGEKEFLEYMKLTIQTRQYGGNNKHTKKTPDTRDTRDTRDSSISPWSPDSSSPSNLSSESPASSSSSISPRIDNTLEVTGTKKLLHRPPNSSSSSLSSSPTTIINLVPRTVTNYKNEPITDQEIINKPQNPQIMTNTPLSITPSSPMDFTDMTYDPKYIAAVHPRFYDGYDAEERARYLEHSEKFFRPLQDIATSPLEAGALGSGTPKQLLVVSSPRHETTLLLAAQKMLDLPKASNPVDRKVSTYTIFVASA